MNTPIKFAVLGYGHIGSKHVSEIENNPDAELIAIIDNGVKAILKAKQKSKTPVFSSLEKFLSDEIDVDVVCICTPNGLHISHAKKCLERGMNVLVEKPLGLHKTECVELIRTAEKHGKKIFCVLQNRYSPPAAYLKKLVDEGMLGKIFLVEVNCYWNRDERYYSEGNWRGTNQLDGGTLFTQFSHFVDLIYWIFGSWKLLGGHFANNNHPQTDFEDTGVFHFKFEKEGTGIFSYSTSLWQQNMQSSIVVIGERGALKIGGHYMDKLEYFHVKDMEKPELEKSNPPNNYGSHTGSASNHAIVIENVIHDLNGQPFHMATVDEASAVVGLIEEIYNLRDSQQ